MRAAASGNAASDVAAKRSASPAKPSASSLPAARSESQTRKWPAALSQKSPDGPGGARCFGVAVVADDDHSKTAARTLRLPTGRNRTVANRITLTVSLCRRQRNEPRKESAQWFNSLVRLEVSKSTATTGPWSIVTENLVR